MSAQICSGLRFTAFGLSLAYATNGTVIEQWSRDYLNKSDTLPSPIERARICSYLYIGHKRFHMPAIVDLIPLLPHMSLLLFFAGLTWQSRSLRSHTPCSLWCLYSSPTARAACRFRVFFGALAKSARRSGRRGAAACLVPIITHGRGHDACANAGSTERDKRALCWTLESLTAEHELEPLVEAIPAVTSCSSAPALLRTGESGFLEDDVRTGLCLDALLALAMAKVGTDTLIFLVEISTLAYVSAVARTSDGCVGAASDVGQLPCAENEALGEGSVD
ncbi:hypothetical protein C8R47DRAFT_1228725 [Mycena vitilis]|nr:hypothetical protein C8R47DRAFT_1228725 [Mycena vitilis]